MAGFLFGDASGHDTRLARPSYRRQLGHTLHADAMAYPSEPSLPLKKSAA